MPHTKLILSWTAMTFVVLNAGGCALLRTGDDPMETYEETRKRLAQQQEPYAVRQANFEQADSKKSDFSAKALTKSFQQITGTGPDAALANQLYTEATDLYRQAGAADEKEKADLFVEAAEKYEEAAKRWPDSSLEQDAMFMAGESYFFADAYPKANLAYEKLLKKHPNSRYLDTVEARRFSVAEYWLDVHRKDPLAFYQFNFTDDTRPRRDTRGYALKIYDGIRIDDPTGKLADDATMAAGMANFENGKYMKALEYYEDLIKTFPASEHQFNAHLFGLKSCLESYQGPDYSDEVLNKGEKLIKQMRKQFPAEAEGKRELLSRAYAEIRYKKAEREWLLGEYYARLGQYGAARYHYKNVINDFSEQPLAERSRKRLTEYEDKPDVPPKRFEFLTRMFPRQQSHGPLIATNPAPTKRK